MHPHLLPGRAAPSSWLLLALVLAWASGAATGRAQTTYYVHPGGDDARDGRSPATAFRTVARINSLRLSPGDRVRFARGGEWREQLVASSEGAPGRPIVYETYGAGAKPRFWGSDPLVPSAFRPVGGGVFQVPATREVHAILADHRFLRSAALRTRSHDPGVNRKYVQSHPGTWCYGEGQLYVHPGDTDPRTDGRVYTAAVREDLIFTNGKKHLLLRDLVVDESAKADAGYAFRITGDDIVLEGCEAYRAGKHHFGVINANEFLGKGLYAAYAMPDQGVGGATAYVSYSDRSRPGDRSRYVNCVAEHLEDTGGGGTYPAFYTHGEGIGSVVLENLISRGAGVGLGNGESGAALRIRGGRLENAALEVFGNKVLVDGLTLTGPRALVTLSGSDNVLQNVLILGPNPGTAGYQAAVVDNGLRNTIRFCTFVLSPEAPSYDAVLSLVKPNSGLSWYGNILLSQGKVLRIWFSGFDPSRYHASYNFYRPGAEFDTRFAGQGKSYSLDGWKTVLDAGSLQGDPKFTDPVKGDYTLSADSPAIDAARLDRGLEKQVPTDFLGHPRFQGKAFDMGAYEFAGPRPQGPGARHRAPEARRLAPTTGGALSAAVGHFPVPASQERL